MACRLIRLVCKNDLHPHDVILLIPILVISIKDLTHHITVSQMAHHFQEIDHDLRDFFQRTYTFDDLLLFLFVNGRIFQNL